MYPLPPPPGVPRRSGHLLRPVHLHGHAVAQRPQLTLGFAICVVQSVGLGRRTMTRGHRLRRQSSFPSLNILCALLVYPSPLFCFYGQSDGNSIVTSSARWELSPCAPGRFM